jgi:2-methylcitrate dehydratase PrpD
MPGFARRVGEFVATTPPQALPDRDREAVDRSLFDTVGAMLAGRTSSPGAIVERTTREAPGGPCTVVGAGMRRGAGAAALANGVAAHADDFDDMGGYGHPSAPIVPALLAAIELEAAEGRPVTGAEAAIAYATGFELGVALCSTGGYDQYERCFHSTPVFGALAAACAASRVLGLDAERTAAAVALAASSGAGLGRSSGTMVKPLHAGSGARSGLLAALAARSGATAPSEVFEARGGFMAAFFGHRALDLEGIADRLGAPFRVADTVFIKRFPCCGSNHSALSAIERIIEDHDVQPDEIDEVIVHGMLETSPVLRFPVPETGTSAKFSIQYVLATMLARRAVGLDDFRDEVVADQEIRALAARVVPEAVNRWDMRGAAKHKGNPVTVVTRDGRRLDAAVLRTDMVGGPRAPLPEDDLTMKFLQNAQRSLAPEAATAATQAWRQVSATDDVAALMRWVA